MSTYKESRKGIGGRKRVNPLPAGVEIKRMEGESDADWKRRYQRENQRVWRRYNREKELARLRELYREKPEVYGPQRQWVQENKDRIRAYSRAHFERNREKKLETLKAWVAADPEAARERTRQWFRRNPHKNAAYASKRRAAEMQATPAWADYAKIEEFYAEARRMTEATGIEHHVDHIIPLRGKTVCGLHVHTNLQVLPAAENLKKRNKFAEAS